MRHVLSIATLALVAVNASAALQLHDVTAEATGPGGAVVSYSSSSTGGPDDENGRPQDNVHCAPASGSLFPLGKTRVACTSTEGGSGAFEVIVVDTTAPVLTLPRDFTVQIQDGSSAEVTYQASASDLVDGSLAAVCTPASGSQFEVGNTTVRCTATDAHHNAASGSFVVSVVDTHPPPPPPPPVPDDITAEATGSGGAAVHFTVSGGSGEDQNGRPTSGATCAPASGSLFPLGTTTVTCTAGTATAQFKVTVVDTTGPALLLPNDFSIPATSAAGATVTYDATATDLVDGAVAIACAPPAGTTFAIGTTAVACTATDSRGNTASGSFAVTVTNTPADGEAPAIIRITATPNILWPPNHKMIAVSIAVEAIDNLDPAPVSRIYDVTVSQDSDPSDVHVTGDLTLELRAERNASPNVDRIYTILIECIDAAGNRSVGSIDVRVPHDSSQNSPVIATPSPKRRAAGRR